jgi:hypothetical protein
VWRRERKKKRGNRIKKQRAKSTVGSERVSVQWLGALVGSETTINNPM